MADSTITFLVLAGVVVLFVSGRVPVAVAALCVPVALWATDVLELDQALAGFGSPTVVFIAAMFIVAEGLDATGVTAWVGQQLLARAGAGRAGLLALMMVACALITALITPNASVAALVPAVVVVAIRTGEPSSQLLMPLAFAAHAGSLLALTGTPVNVLISEAATDAGVGEVGFFEFALVGVPVLIGTIAITVLLGGVVLPRRNADAMPADFSSLAATLVRDYGLDRDANLYDRNRGAVEIVIPPRSGLIGTTTFAGMVTPSGDLVVLGIQRDGHRLEGGEIELAAGDALLVRGTWEALSDQATDDVLVVDSPTLIKRQLVAFGRGAKQAVTVLTAMVLLLASGAVPPAIAALLAAGTIVVLRIVGIDDAYRAIAWTTVVLVGCMIPLSTAMQSTGAAEKIADQLVDVVGDGGPYVLTAGLFVIVLVLGQLISNTATALIAIPIAVSAAVELDVSAKPILMAVNVAAAAALLTPVATPANMMVMEPGGYRFGDYWRLGLPLAMWYGVVAIGLVPLIWNF